MVLCRGNYLSAVAEIGTFEHCLTTDLLNHLVFVQKVFMTEVNDVLNKVSGSDKPVPLWEDWPGDGLHHDDSSSALRMLLYNLIVRLKVSFFNAFARSIKLICAGFEDLLIFLTRVGYSNYGNNTDKYCSPPRNRSRRTAVV